MVLLPYIIPFVYLVLLESLTVRWVAGGPVPGLISRIFATNLAGLALLFFITLTGWFFGWWPDMPNWALRDSFFLFLMIKAPIFAFLFRRWGAQRVFTLHILGNFISVIVMSLLFVYSPQVLSIPEVTENSLNSRAVTSLKEIRDAVDSYHVAHGFYPVYIWGGDMVSWRAAGPGPSPDPLLNEGYMPAYPVNPLNLRRTFFEPRRASGWRELWFGHKSTDFIHVRNLWQPVAESDPRFGYRGAKMGNVLPDPRLPETRLPQDVRFTIQSRWLPGGFFYRSFDLDEDGRADAYILGVCGDENAQATVDCYDARLDGVTRLIGNHRVPSAFDGIRDGVIYRLHRGFDGRPAPERALPRPPVPLDQVPSAGLTEPLEPPPEEGTDGDVE